MATDFLKDYQAQAQQSWDAWTRYMQQQPAGGSAFFNPAGFNPAAFAAPGMPPQGGPAGDLLARSMAGLKSYTEWLQGAASSGIGQGGDWQRQLQDLFAGAGGQPFAQAFAGIDTAGAQGFAQSWQSWLQAAQSGGLGGLPGMGPMPAFGYTREQQMQQQALAAAVREYLETQGRYQALIQRANTEGFERLQSQLSQLTERGQQLDSLKALYDQWVDASEAAYAEIALSDEFRVAYGDMVNAQMRVRHLQQQQLEAYCRELGMPTRSEVTALSKQMHELRRELRTGSKQAGVKPANAASDEAADLRAEIAALKRKLAENTSKASAPKESRPASATPIRKAATSSAKSQASKSAPSKTPARKASASRKPVAKTATRRK
ncbi:poly(R)-hydroxyalkanoic acid synthase subunit PhaE [Dyella tabacisoli]|uniref:Poly(3-hydroxyalkanoate) polymerase subunit PhaE n=1 Tax=Dyella tabacisoli TaxID=2282381 RepID=A0A369UK92_9GAMM|nr:poly(R)-hydroxyalkanoic acid synthase subunit PhaE [Dyella tabacisoli]RDD81182.1 pha synthase subunit protein [Dyella tabacisoli]